ncbi:MAG: hypothetical protein HC835_11005 [Oscillatoriales cyanobacterium RM2_1_1]|nr:hypothetical protein [Oscillatoriales cyanobacterium RM2_1_1]
MSISRAGSTGDHQNSFQNHFQNNFDAFGMPAVDFSLTAGVRRSRQDEDELPTIPDLDPILEPTPPSN